MLIYLATPYSTEDSDLKNERIRKLNLIVSAFFNLKRNIISPILHNYTLFDQGLINDCSWKFWEKYCLSILSKCDEMYVFKDTYWEKSIGVQAEIKFAEANKIPIKYFTFVNNNIIFEPKEIMGKYIKNIKDNFKK